MVININIFLILKRLLVSKITAKITKTRLILKSIWIKVNKYRTNNN